MKRFSRLYEQTAEFRARCKAFDFAVVAHAVIDAALASRKALKNMARNALAMLRMPRPAEKKPHQLVLELNSIAQIPLFAAAC